MVCYALTIEPDRPAFFNPIYRKNCTLTKFPDYGEIEQIRVGNRYTLRLFIKHRQNGEERIDGGMVDVKILKQEGDNFSGEILTLLPNNFPLKKGDCINLSKDEILFEQK